MTKPMTSYFSRNLALLAAIAGIALAIASPALAQSSSRSVVDVQATGPAAPVAAGETFTATVSLNIRSGYHINAQKPSEDYLIGTNVSVKPPAGFSVVRSAYPPSKMGRFSFSEVPIAVYDGTAQITVTLKVDASASPGTSTIPATVEFQACNDDQCLPPSTVDVSFPVEVTAAATGAEGEKQQLTVTGLPPAARVFVDGKLAGTADSQGRAVIRDVLIGRHRLRIEAAGYATLEKEIAVNLDAPSIVEAPLVPDPNANANASATAATVPGPGVPAAASSVNANSTAQDSASDSSNWLLWLLGGIIVVSLAGIGIVAATRAR